MTIRTLETMEGSFPRRAKALVVEWALENREELRENWELAGNHLPLNKIKPLE